MIDKLKEIKLATQGIIDTLEIASEHGETANPAVVAHHLKEQILSELNDLIEKNEFTSLQSTKFKEGELIKIREGKFKGHTGHIVDNEIPIISVMLTIGKEVVHVREYYIEKYKPLNNGLS